MEAHFGAVDAHNRGLDAHNRGLEAHNGAVKCLRTHGYRLSLSRETGTGSAQSKMLDPDPHHTGKPDPYPIRNTVLDNPKFPQRMCAEVQYGPWLGSLVGSLAWYPASERKELCVV